MRFLQTPLIQPLALLLAATGHVSAQGSQFLVSEQSFGYNGRIEIDKSDPSRIPGFVLLGNPNLPEVLSNKIILTPPAPGNQRGAIWSERPLPYNTWTADVDFRVSGPERGSGNLNVWLASEGSYRVTTSSIYTVNAFDGLAIVIDQHGGSGGTIRGFLNDGTIDYRSHQAVDSLAFGHCLFPYRNRGGASQLKIKHSADSFGLRVEIDGRLCFETDKVRIPPGYVLGITSASAENPDSHEVFKMVVMTDNLTPGSQQQQGQGGQQQQKPVGGKEEKARFGRGGMFQDRGSPTEEFEEDDIADESADTITSSKAQFADLHNRLQSVNHHLSTIFRHLGSQASVDEKRHEETSKMIDEVKQVLNKLNRLDDINNRLMSIEKEIRIIKTDLGQQIRNNENSIKGYVSDTHEVLHQRVLEATPGHGRLILVVVGSQIVVVGLYVYYKRRKTTPKKFL